MKKLIFLLFVLSNILNQVGAQELEMKLLVEKNNYLEQEPITAIVVLKNISNKAIDVRDFGNVANGANVNLIIENKDKEVLELSNFYKGVNAIFIKPKLIEPGHTTSTVFFIDRCYGNNDPKHNNGINIVVLAPYFARRFLLEGKYRMYAKYEYRPGNVIQSNVTEINVQKPHSNVQLQVYNELKKAASEFDNGNTEEYYSILLTIIKNYPDNPYTKIAYSQIFNLLNGAKLDNELVKGLINDYTTHFGDSFETYINIYPLLYKLKDNEFINKIIDQMNNKQLYEYLYPYGTLYFNE